MVPIAGPPISGAGRSADAGNGLRQQGPEEFGVLGADDLRAPLVQVDRVRSRSRHQEANGGLGGGLHIARRHGDPEGACAEQLLNPTHLEGDERGANGGGLDEHLGQAFDLAEQDYYIRGGENPGGIGHMAQQARMLGELPISETGLESTS